MKLVNNLSLIISMILQACGKPAYKDPEVMDLVKRFEEQYKVDLYAIDIRFVDKIEKPQEDAVGVCYQGTGIIKLRSDYWVYANDTQRMVLLYHELGHCYFGRIEHVEDKYEEDRCEKSIMSSHVMGEHCFNKHAVELLNELPGR